jgi:sugar phosphate permease
MQKIIRADVVSVRAANASDDILVRKVTWRIVPFLFVCYVVCFIDRTNVGFAQLQMKQDLGFSDATYGLGVAVFSIGYTLFELPSNMLLMKFGARRTFARIMLLWGAASVSMMLVSKPAHFYAIRFFLGVFEAGFLPGIIFYLTRWIPANRRAGVISVFFAGIAVAGILGGLFSGWIMRGMDGTMGLFGWQWMFAMEGAPAIVLSLFTLVYVVEKPAEASWLTKDEKVRLVALCASRGALLAEPPVHGFWAVLLNPLVYVFAFIYFTLTCASVTLGFWMPLMVRDFGITDIVSVSLYTMIPNIVGAIGLVLIARSSDLSGKKYRYFATCTICGGLAFALLTLHMGSLLGMATLSVATVLVYSALPIFWSIPTNYLSERTAAPGIALISTIGQGSGFVQWLIGAIRTSTGSMNAAIYVLAILLIISGVSMVFGVRRRLEVP